MKHYFWIHIALCVAVSSPLVSCPLVFGDSWGWPKRDHWSANEKWGLILGYRGGKTLSLCEKTEDGLKEYWRRGYVDSVFPPHRAYVTDNGKYVVLRDVFHNLGHGKVIVILGDQGKILGSYELRDFLSVDEILQAERSVSSIWWNRHAWFSFIEDDSQFALVTRVGTVRSFDLSTGKLLDLSEDQRGKIADMVRHKPEAWVQSEKAGERIRGIRMLGGMGVSDAIPTAKRLFQDKTPTGSVERSEGTVAETYGVQTAAAEALIRLLGVDAIPIIEEELPKANWHMKKKLLSVLETFDTRAYEIVETPDSAILVEMWKRLSKHTLDDIRYPALCQVLCRDDGTYLLEHPELIESESDSVRGTAVWLLGKVESPRASTLLRKAITDKKDSIRHSALRDLIDRNPPDIEEVLLRYLDDESASMRVEVICELVCWGHPFAMAKLRETIATWPNADLEGEGKWQRRNEIETLCKLIADLKLKEVRDSLEATRPVPATSTRTAVTGALAALGDSQALSDLHRIASEGAALDRICAIQMCRYLLDDESVALVKKAAERGSDFRGPATEKLRRFHDKRKTSAAHNP